MTRPQGNRSAEQVSRQGIEGVGYAWVDVREQMQTYDLARKTAG